MMPLYKSSPAAARELWHNSCNDSWDKYLDSYEQTVDAVAESKNKSELIVLDRWQCHELKAEIESRSTASLTVAELSRIMTWKLARGQFRPGLQNKADSNSEDDCKTATTAALAIALKVHEDILARGNYEGAQTMKHSANAINALSKGPPKLKGIGPASASAILSAVYNSFPFMSDEALAAALQPKTSFQYSAKEYAEFCQKMRQKAQELTCSGRPWNAGMVEHALWSAAWQKREPGPTGSRKRKHAK